MNVLVRMIQIEFWTLSKNFYFRKTVIFICNLVARLHFLQTFSHSIYSFRKVPKSVNQSPSFECLTSIPHPTSHDYYGTGFPGRTFTGQIISPLTELLQQVSKNKTVNGPFLPFQNVENHAKKGPYKKNGALKRVTEGFPL